MHTLDVDFFSGVSFFLDWRDVECYRHGRAKQKDVAPYGDETGVHWIVTDDQIRQILRLCQ